MFNTLTTGALVLSLLFIRDQIALEESIEDQENLYATTILIMGLFIAMTFFKEW